MSASPPPKKPAHDWHRADIVAALHKEGWSLRELSRQSALSAGTLKAALDRPWPKAERIIATAIGVAPESIWPSRYKRRHFKPVLSHVSERTEETHQLGAPESGLSTPVDDVCRPKSPKTTPIAFPGKEPVPCQSV